jgi:hypothetical protein
MSDTLSDARCVLDGPGARLSATFAFEPCHKPETLMDTVAVACGALVANCAPMVV